MQRIVAAMIACAAALAQAQPAEEGMRRVGFLAHSAAEDAATRAQLAAFLRKLEELGFAHGRTLQLETRYAAGDYDRMKSKVSEELKQHFRPEFLNRVDEIIVFHALTRAEMRSIIDIQLKGLMKRLEERKIRVELSERAKDLLIAEGYDPTYGARPLKRTIQREILDPLAMRVLQGEFKEGDVIRVDEVGGKLQFARDEKTVQA